MSAINYDHWLWIIPVILFGLSIGSFLNVIIYRLPQRLSVNSPKRSFCPACKGTLKAWHNIPVLSWVLLRGKCAFCSAQISWRYPAVEVCTAGLFLCVWISFPPIVAPFLWILCAIFVVVALIDVDHMIIPTELTWAGTVFGLIACAVWPQISDLSSYNETWKEGMSGGVIGWSFGFFGLWAVVELGKKAFGIRKLEFEQETPWRLQEGQTDEEPLRLIVGDEAFDWWDVFSRKSDKIRIECSDLFLDTKNLGPSTVTIRAAEIEVEGQEIVSLNDLNSLHGSLRKIAIPREAMGMGDIHLLGMIGAFFGWSGVIFSLFGASFIGVFVALLGKVGLGRPLPFGPFLSLSALAWLLGGWKLWRWYVGFLGL